MTVPHSAITGAENHEPKGAETAANGQIYVSNGAGTGVWRALATTDIPVNTYYKVTSQTLATTSGTTKDFTIPAGIQRINVIVDGNSTTGTSALLVQIGPSGGVETTSYVNAQSCAPAISNVTSVIGFPFSAGTAAAASINGTMTLNTTTSNRWVETHVGQRTDTTVGCYGAGSKTIAGTIAILRLTTVNGTDIFDAGSATVICESF